mmetsp:Transcript_118237/g.378901  ORF Transcript_118237/g.378901 Transcript_118237/m.378901 type:complete len:264 (+) Transcript_118237:807-1598(+)
MLTAQPPASVSQASDSQQARATRSPPEEGLRASSLRSRAPAPARRHCRSTPRPVLSSASVIETAPAAEDALPDDGRPRSTSDTEMVSHSPPSAGPSICARRSKLSRDLKSQATSLCFSPLNLTVVHWKTLDLMNAFTSSDTPSSPPSAGRSRCDEARRLESSSAARDSSCAKPPRLRDSFGEAEPPGEPFRSATDGDVERSRPSGGGAAGASGAGRGFRAPPSAASPKLCASSEAPLNHCAGTRTGMQELMSSASTPTASLIS